MEKRTLVLIIVPRVISLLLPSQMFVEYYESHKHRVCNYAQADKCECYGSLGFSFRMALKRSTAIGQGPVWSRISKVGRTNHHHRSSSCKKSSYMINNIWFIFKYYIMYIVQCELRKIKVFFMALVQVHVFSIHIKYILYFIHGYLLKFKTYKVNYVLFIIVRNNP